MENSNRIELTIDASATAYEWHGNESAPTLGLRTLCETLEALGMAVRLDESDSEAPRLSIDFPDPYEAEKLRNRGGGRPKAEAFTLRDAATGLPLTSRETLEWLEGHTVDQGREAMGGVSRRTYYRRLSELRRSVPLS